MNETEDVVLPSQDKKQNWDLIYNAKYPTLYQNELMKKCNIHEKNRSLKRVFDTEILKLCQLESEKRSLNCIDLLSSYGDSFLALINGMTPEEILEAWDSEENSLNIKNSRRFNCQTLGVDISENAIKYAKKAGIFNHILQIDINNMNDTDSNTLGEHLKKADIIHLGSPGYMSMESFAFVVDNFIQGNPHFGYFIVSFNSLFMKSHKEFKQYILNKLNFIDCEGGFQRHLLKHEEQSFHVKSVYNTTWLMKR